MPTLNETTLALLLIIAISVGLALLSHTFIKQILPASLITGLAATLLFQLISYLHLGHLDPFFPVAIIFGFAVAAFIAAILALPFELHRRRQH